jgi:hypothetical protein
MQDSSSPGHHIAVQMNDAVLQAVTHHRASTAIFESMKRAAATPAHRAQFGNEELVVVTGVTRDDTDMKTLVHSLLEPDNVPHPEAYLKKPVDGPTLLRTIQVALSSAKAAT